jgi:hypothetical protein
MPFVFYPERQMPGDNSTLPPTSVGTSLTGLKTNGQTGSPNHLGTMLPSSRNNTNTGTPPASTVTKEHNPSAPKLFSSTSKPTSLVIIINKHQEYLHLTPAVVALQAKVVAAAVMVAAVAVLVLGHTTTIINAIILKNSGSDLMHG